MIIGAAKISPKVVLFLLFNTIFLMTRNIKCLLFALCGMCYLCLFRGIIPLTEVTEMSAYISFRKVLSVGQVESASAC